MLPFEKVKSVIASADDKTIKGLQDKAILACLFGGALRRSEIVNLRMDDVKRSSKGTLFLYLRSTKAGKDASQALPAWAAEIVQTQLKERRKRGAQPIDPLFSSFRGKAGLIATDFGISSSGVYKLFKLYCRRAGIGDFFTPHSARATSITKLLSEGIPHRQVQEFSRHSSVQMVELYDKRRIGVDDNVAKDLDFD
jgi:integrase